MANERQKHNLAAALIRFNDAYQHLVACSKALPDLDVSENYPFYLLDFEAIAPAVAQWAKTHATKLFNELPYDIHDIRADAPEAKNDTTDN